MKSYFMEKQPAVKVIEQNDKYFVFICLNETESQKNDNISPTDDQNAYLEYDYNEFICKKEDLDLDDIKTNPEKYLTYPPREKSDKERITELEELNTELSAAMDYILTDILPSVTKE